MDESSKILGGKILLVHLILDRVALVQHDNRTFDNVAHFKYFTGALMMQVSAF